MTRECPLNKWEPVIRGYPKRQCTQKRCAWWLENAEECAVVGLVGLLDGVINTRRVG